jgi:hypothetical protein
MSDQEIIRINVKMLASLSAVIMAFIAGIAWGVRLEYRTEENDRANIRQDIELKQLAHDQAESHDRLTRMESDVAHIVKGIEEIKALVKTGGQ